jgi:chaperone required for assembly of F1-ATPase
MADPALVKRFWKDVSVEEPGGSFRVLLDGRAIRTQGGAPQVVPTRALAEAMADEWRAQGEQVDPRGFPLRDLADFALDHVRPDRTTVIAKLLTYAETDTLCYRADPDEPLYRRQKALWDPMLALIEKRQGVRFERVHGVVHRPQPPETLARLRALLAKQDDFTLSALHALAPLAASLTVALIALDPGYDIPGLFEAANCEQDWQAELWGWEEEAERDRAKRLAGFAAAARFAQLAQPTHSAT